MQKQIGIGIIGMGWMGQAHSRAYLMYATRFASTIKPKLIICSEIILKRAKEAKEQFGFESYSTSWRDVVDHPLVEVVDITAPNALHFEIISYCIQKGKHINCEKPVGAFPAQTLQSYELSKAHPTIQTFVGFNYRWCPMVAYAKALIKEGSLGEIYSYKGRFFSCYGAHANSSHSWRFEKEHGFGAMGDLLVHVIDMALYLVGEIQNVVGVMKTFITKRPVAREGASHYDRANGEFREVSNEDYAAARVEFGNGAEGFIESSRVFFGPTSEFAFEIYGSKGSIKWNFEEMNALWVCLLEEEASMGYKKILSSPLHPYHGFFNPSCGSGLGYEDLKVIEIANFLQKIQNPHSQEVVDFSDAAKVARVMEAIIQSSEQKAVPVLRV